MQVELSYNIWEYEDITAEELTELIGLTPSTVFRIGLPIRPNVPRLSRHNAWMYKSPVLAGNPDALFEEQLAALFEVLENKKHILQPLGRKYACEISCGIYIDCVNDVSTPATYLEKWHIELMAFIGAALNFDMILLGDKF